jgi:hypothetical protein
MTEEARFATHYAYTYKFARWQQGYAHFLEHGAGVLYVENGRTRYVVRQELETCILDAGVLAGVRGQLDQGAPETRQISCIRARDNIYMIVVHQRAPRLSQSIHDVDPSFREFVNRAYWMGVTSAQILLLWNALLVGNQALTTLYESRRHDKTRDVHYVDGSEREGHLLELKEVLMYNLPEPRAKENIGRIVRSRANLSRDSKCIFIVRAITRDVIEFSRERGVPLLRGVLPPCERGSPALDDAQCLVWCPFVGPASLCCDGPGCVVDAEARSGQRCSRCKHTLYCSKACQRAAWPEHKAVCKPPS